jgi:hypothetical protein
MRRIRNLAFVFLATTLVLGLQSKVFATDWGTCYYPDDPDETLLSCPFTNGPQCGFSCEDEGYGWLMVDQSNCYDSNDDFWGYVTPTHGFCTYQRCVPYFSSCDPNHDVCCEGGCVPDDYFNYTCE